MRRTLYCGPFVLAAMTLLVALTMPLRLSKAANLFWDGTGTSWNTASFWSITSSATTPNPAAKPGSADIADFNITAVNTAQTVNLDAAQSALGLVFGSTGTVLIQSGSGTNTLAVGLSGITVNAGAGADTISSAVSLAAGQSWTNNSSNLLTDSGTISTGAFSVGGSGNITLSGSVNSVNNVLTKTGSGTLTLSGATDNNSLAVTVNSGTVVLAKTSSSSPNDVHAIGQDALTVSGGTAQLGGTGGDQIYDLGSVAVTSGAFDTNARSETFSTLNLQGTGIGGAGALVNTAAGASTITPTNRTTLNANTTIGVTQSGGSLTLNNVVSGTFALTKVGAGTLSLTGANTFTGGLTINAGSVILGNAGALNSTTPNAISFGSNSTGALTLNGHSVTVNGLTTDATVGTPFVENKSATPATLTVNNLSDNTYAGLLQDSAGGGALSLTQSGGGKLLLSGNNTFSGGVNLTAGTLLVGSDSAIGSGILHLAGGTIGADGAARVVSNPLTVGGAFGFSGSDDLTLSSDIIDMNSSLGITVTGTGIATLSGDISTSVGFTLLRKFGAGTLRLSGDNFSHGGGIEVTDGTLLVGSVSASRGTLTINGGTVDLDTFSQAIPSLDFIAGSLSLTGNLTFGTGGFSLLGPDPTITANQTVNATGTTTIDSTGTLTLNGGTLNTNALVINGAFNFFGGTLGITGPAGLTIGSGSPLATNFLLGTGNRLNVTNTLHIDGVGRLTNVGGNVLVGNVQLDAGGRWTVSDGVQSVGTGLVNHGTLVLIDTTINGPVNSPAGSVIDVIGGVTFNQLVSGAGQFFGSGTTTFNGGFHPGGSPATVNFQGGVALGGGNTLAIELGGLTPGAQYDQVQVAGQLLLGGTLAVSYINGFTPLSGNSFDILDWGALSGTFSTIVLPTLADGLAWNTSQLYTAGVLSIDSVGLSGDYNNNGVVDAADYVVWRANQGTNNVLPNDPVGGTIGTAQYNQWRAHFGQSAGSGLGISSNTAIPEPATLNMLFTGLLALCSRRRSAT